MQVGGSTVPTPAQAAPTPTVPPAVTPLPVNVPRKAQVGRPARVAKPKLPLPVVAAGLKKVAPPKPPVTRSKTKNQPTSVNVAVTDPENNTMAPVDVEYNTDELAELPMDSKPEPVESEPGEENAQIEKQ